MAALSKLGMIPCSWKPVMLGYPCRAFNHSCHPNVFMYTVGKLCVRDASYNFGMTSCSRDGIIQGYPSRTFSHACNPSMFYVHAWRC
ncbi:expressed unknown protein [Ectocarpus siliculosus]|uniref:SET domain-containing protein n=1 Tax=Ectocarpus siliculosus TaxID=2880 RepID=D8LST3_ECTSI|nr:expressed unknown protein [Ectocarpus siliculosus]|eukprot:CBN75283.1 expressed unknown protein [Ectocarpus siliculosus]